MYKQGLVILVVILTSAVLWGCGSGGGSGGSSVTDTTVLGTDAQGNAVVSSAACIDCHDRFSWSAEIVADYLAGKHVIHSDHITAESDAACLECHDPYGDGPGLEALIDAANVPAEGLAAVGCESCHGGGGDHFGVGPIPIAEPGIDQCAACHDALPTDHLTYHPEADNISTDFVASRHYTASVRNEALCSKCHTDEGGRLYKNVSTNTQLVATVLPVASDAPVQCRTCHNPHNAGGLLMEEVENRGEVVASAEYATCVTCHMSDSDDPADAEWMYHQDVYYRVITDTHYDDPATTAVIEGYIVDPISERACRDCHAVHKVEEIRADTGSSSFSDTINDQWSKSAHGGFIGLIKLGEAEQGAAGNRTLAQTQNVKAAGVDSTTADGWLHYDWDAQNRQSCQLCHTSTGLKNYTADPVGYDPANNDFSNLVGWEKDPGTGAITPSGQNEMLFCWGCHDDLVNGGIRQDDAVTLGYDYDDGSGAVPVVLPDLGNSNICAICHGGRGNTTSIEDAFASGSPSSRFAGHHAPTAGTLFSAQTHIGYEYPGQDYNDRSFFRHSRIGTDVTGDSDANRFAATIALIGTETGPCVGCHMPDSDHNFAALEWDDNGTIADLSDDFATGISSQAVCDACHTSTSMTLTVLEDESAAYQNASLFLNNLLNNVETNYKNKVINQTTAVADGDVEDYGAFQNAKIATEDPAGYVHNRFKVKRLIFDSIDWLDNGVLNGTITVDSSTYTDAATWFGWDVLTDPAGNYTASRP